MIVVAGYVVLWFYWRGRNWARWLVLLSCFLCFLNLTNFPGRNVVTQFMLVAEAVLAVLLRYWLDTREAKEFFRPTTQRAQPQPSPDPNAGSART